MTRRKHLISAVPERLGYTGAHSILVLDQQDGLVSIRMQRFVLSADQLLLAGYGGSARKIEIEPAAMSRRAGDANVSARLGDDRVHRCQPEAGPLALRLGREEWLEDAIAGHRIH